MAERPGYAELGLEGPADETVTFTFRLISLLQPRSDTLYLARIHPGVYRPRPQAHYQVICLNQDGCDNIE